LDLNKKIKNKTNSNIKFQTLDNYKKRDILLSETSINQNEIDEDIDIIIGQLNLEDDESNFLKLFSSGEKLKDIKESGIPVDQIRKSLRKKIDKTIFFS
jgi:hypothetical protein